MPAPPVKRRRAVDSDYTSLANEELRRRKQEDAEVTREERKAKQRGVDLDGAAIEDNIKRLLGMSTFEPEQRYWLDTGSRDLNGVFGSRKRGIPYGKIAEVAGEKHGGKTALVTILAGMAQRDGAAVGYVDLEDSRDPVWSRKLGLQYEQVVKLWPKFLTGKRKGKKKKKGDTSAPQPKGALRLESAEEVFKEAETGMRLLSEAGYKKQFWIVDSIANIQTELSVDAGTTDRNMRVNVDRALFLSATLPRWSALAANYNASIFFINQLRLKPGVMFGDPHYTPGGNAVPFAASIQVRVKRKKGGRVRSGDRIIGIIGGIENIKNKAGGGSREGRKCGFKITWNKPTARIRFMSYTELEEEVK